ncbi:hypothetical protein BSKO_09277 [Bryopsis sp. KO-2023]|nr:hypothetical protein BSKO_09277 [Bryopsis sp. KO-2023]
MAGYALGPGLRDTHTLYNDALPPRGPSEGCIAPGTCFTGGVVHGGDRQAGNGAQASGGKGRRLGRVARFCRALLGKTTCGPRAPDINRTHSFLDGSDNTHDRVSRDIHRSMSETTASRIVAGITPRNHPSCFVSGGVEGDDAGAVVPRHTRATHNRFDFRDLILERSIGRGAFGTVYKAVLSRKPVALKIICHAASQPTTRVAPEFELLHGICHPNIVQVLGVHENMEGFFEGGDSVGVREIDSYDSACFTDVARDVPQKGGKQDTCETWVIMEYCDRGSLWDAVLAGCFGDGKVCLYSKVVEVALEVAFAMQHLHEVGIIHGDLKAQNVMLQGSNSSKKNFVAKVGDFGLCRRPFDRTDMSTFSWGTVDHMPPEMLRNGKLRFATDVFSFAILLVEMMTGERPFGNMGSPAIIIGIVEGMRPEIPRRCPQPLVDLIHDCWHENWRMRPQFGSVVSRLKDIMFSVRSMGRGGMPTSEGSLKRSAVATASSERIGAWALTPHGSEDGSRHRFDSTEWTTASFFESNSSLDRDLPGFHRNDDI